MSRGLKRCVRLILYTAMMSCILTGYGKQAPKEKTVVEILYSNHFKQVGKLVESTYDDIDLRTEISPYSSEELYRLERGVGPELVIAARPDSDMVQKYLLDLSGIRASSAYDGTIMSDLKQDGKMYLIPLPDVHSGYTANETMFRQAGISMSTNNTELIEALAKLKEKGLGVGENHTNFSMRSDYNAEAGMLYMGCMIPDFLGTVEGVQWLADFKEKKAMFTGVWEESFVLPDELANAGIMNPAIIACQRNSILCEQRLSNGTLVAALGDSSLHYACVEQNRKEALKGTAEAYSYRMLPLLGNEGNHPWFMFAPSTLMGVNNAINEEKQEACKRIADLLSIPEGQAALIQDMGPGISRLLEYQQQEDWIPADVEEYIESGYIYSMSFPSKTIEYLGDCVRDVMAGRCTVEEALQDIDNYYYKGTGKSEYGFTIIDEMAHDLLMENLNTRREKTEIGNFVADYVAEVSGAPIAVVNGGGIWASFHQGMVYDGDATTVCPLDNRIIVVEMDGQTVWDMLEGGLSTCTGEFPGEQFLQVFGLYYTFDSSKPAGSRLVSVTWPDGTALERSEHFQVAISDYTAGINSYAEGNGDGYAMLNCYNGETPKSSVSLVNEVEYCYRDAMMLYFEEHRDEVVDVQLEGRIRNLVKEQ